MKNLLFLFFLLNTLPAYSQVNFEDYCFSSGGEKPVRFKLRIYDDIHSKWSGAFVKYEKSNKSISLVPEYSQNDELDKNHPFQTTENWLEISGNKISGEYEMISQGANVYSMTYTNNSTHKKFYFNFDPNIAPSERGECNW
ncbi:hypothetical protein R75461_00922 [Paraburkholderia nemoris]|jgi:hypothetical protein|uniref:hypothetical protein n=1 Tax=Paraburkholderia nemoris TaxID=2793076 RepID=UPI00190BC87D|nr:MULTISPECIES: hypothetical protein [Paraburkholderia]MBK3779256.1 hypothetical protein [Paraburkholderia aspalathi]CAE6707363.1 hypothetical protein R75461_00922 [Paraburkholderia nemoris]